MYGFASSQKLCMVFLGPLGNLESCHGDYAKHHLVMCRFVTIIWSCGTKKIIICFT